MNTGMAHPRCDLMLLVFHLQLTLWHAEPGRGNNRKQEEAAKTEEQCEPGNLRQVVPLEPSDASLAT